MQAKKQTQMMVGRAHFSRHDRNDWCHLCGQRESVLADIGYPRNAEHDFKRTEYIRICSCCGERIMRVCGCMD